VQTSKTLNQVFFVVSGCVALCASAGVALSTPLATASLTTLADPDGSLTLSGSVITTLNDVATLSGGVDPTGTIAFTLTSSGSRVDAQIVTLNGNGNYTTPTGFTLPTTGTVIGTYTWTASYSGDLNNNPVGDNSSPGDEQVTVYPASPSLGTTASAGGLVGSTLNDSAILSGGYFPTGTITFTLTGPGGSAVGTETVMVNGNGSYATPQGFTTSSAGQYLWEATYSGDGDNLNETASLEPVSVAAPTSVPEPGSFALLGSALGGLGAIRRRLRNRPF